MSAEQTPAPKRTLPQRDDKLAHMLPDGEHGDPVANAQPGSSVGAGGDDSVPLPSPDPAGALLRYRDLFVNLAEGVVFQDADGRIIDANPAALRLLGMSMDQLVGLTALDPRWRAIHLDGTEIPGALYPGVVARRTGQAVRDAILGVFIPGEEQYHWLRVNAIPRLVPGRERPVGVFVTFTDITGWDYLKQAARIQEARYQALLEQAADAVFVADLNGCFIEVNSAACTMLGYEREELLSKRVVDLIAPEHIPRLAEARREMLQGQTYRGEWRLRRKDGVLVPVELSARIMLDGRWQASVRDISMRKRLEQEVRERTEQLTRTFEAMHEGVYVYDHTGQLLQMNASARALAGYDVHPELEGEPTSERMARLQPRDIMGRPMSAEEWPVRRALRGETITGAAPVEMVVTSHSGSEAVMHVTAAPLRDPEGQIVGAVVVTHDVTEQRRLERELAARAREIESIFETDADAVMLFDTNGRTIRMNAAQKRLLGYDAVGQVGYIAPEDRARMYAISDAQGNPLPQDAWPIYRVLRGETLVGPRAVEMRMRTLDGREVQVSISGAPLYDQQGRIVGGVTSSRDVSEQRRLERQRMDILRVVAHDLASPLTAVKMYLQTQQRSIERGLPPRLPDAQLLETMSHSVLRMERLLGDMRVVVGLESHELALDIQPFDLVALCQQEVRFLLVAEIRELRLNLPDEPVMVQADRDRIGQVLANLLSNADRYSPIEQPITLTLCIERGTTAAGGAQVRVLIRDEGAGIPEQEQAHIWERFHRVAGAQPRPSTGVSLGLGLYISREIIERHGGTMGLESAPGKGSTFWFTLPLAESGA